MGQSTESFIFSIDFIDRSIDRNHQQLYTCIQFPLVDIRVKFPVKAIHSCMSSTNMHSRAIQDILQLRIHYQRMPTPGADGLRPDSQSRLPT